MIVDPNVETYLAGLNPPTDPTIVEMERLGRERGFPIIGPLVGRLCASLTQMIGGRTVYELGSGFGYSTWWFATAVGPEGKVVHTDWSAERSAEARAHLTEAGLVDRVRFSVGEALELFREETGPFDVVFCDVDKDAYPEALGLACDRLRSGGLLITDNVLWSGRVAQPDPDATTQAVLRYNELAATSNRLETVIIPLRDGVSVSRRR